MFLHHAWCDVKNSFGNGKKYSHAPFVASHKPSSANFVLINSAKEVSWKKYVKYHFPFVIIIHWFLSASAKFLDWMHELEFFGLVSFCIFWHWKFLAYGINFWCYRLSNINSSWVVGPWLHLCHSSLWSCQCKLVFFCSELHASLFAYCN